MNNNKNIQEGFQDCFPIFVVGAARSGTTMLQLIINAHPKIAIFGEIHYFDQILQIKRFIPSMSRDEDLEKFFSFVRRIRAFQFLPGIEEILSGVKDRMLVIKSRTYEGFYRILLEEYAKIKGATRFGEKTPGNVRHIDQLFRIFPNAKVIHIIRDPRDVVASSLKMPDASKDIIIHALSWASDIVLGNHFSNREESYIEVRYEDLTQHPKEEMERLCRFVGEEYSETMLEFYKTSTNYFKNEPWKKGTLKRVNTQSIRKGEKVLSRSKIFIIQKLTGFLMREYGYEFSSIAFNKKLLAFIYLPIELLKSSMHQIKKMNLRRKPNKNLIVSGQNQALPKTFFSLLLKRPNVKARHSAYYPETQ
ncbi:MAG TPA: sulfotransferase [Nitrospiria bacterium]